MRPAFVKICGLSTPESIDAVIDGDATHIGFIFFDKSPRNVSLETAYHLSEHTGNRIAKVAVSVNASDALLETIVERVLPDMLQLHGKESPERVETVKNRFGLPVIKALSMGHTKDIEGAKTYIGVADEFLFDAKAPESSVIPGGNGVAFDWEMMDQWPGDVPYILSGGLNVRNIEDALEITQAYGIDASSGVESAPGQKDISMIRDFLRLVTKKDERVE